MRRNSNEDAAQAAAMKSKTESRVTERHGSVTGVYRSLQSSLYRIEFRYHEFRTIFHHSLSIVPCQTNIIHNVYPITLTIMNARSGYHSPQIQFNPDSGVNDRFQRTVVGGGTAGKFVTSTYSGGVSAFVYTGGASIPGPRSYRFSPPK
jgi:hypothetical protein